MDTTDKILSTGFGGPSGPAPTGAEIVAALLAASLSNTQKAQAAAALGFPVHATLVLANAALPTGRTYYNTTLNVYDTTTA